MHKKNDELPFKVCFENYYAPEEKNRVYRIKNRAEKIGKKVHTSVWFRLPFGTKILYQTIGLGTNALNNIKEPNVNKAENIKRIIS